MGRGQGRTRLTFHLRKGVKWHDGKPFTAQDVKCTWDMLSGKSRRLCESARRAHVGFVKLGAAGGAEQ